MFSYHPPHPSCPPDACCVFSSIRRTFSYSSFFRPLPSTLFSSAKRYIIPATECYTVRRTLYCPPNVIPTAWHLSLPFEPLPARPLSIHPPDSISKNFTLRLVRLVRLTHRAHQAQIAVLDASLRTHFVRTRTLPVRAPQTPPGANPPASSIFSQP